MLMGLALCMGLIGCRHSEPPPAKLHVSAEALKGAGAVYAKFQAAIHATPPDNEFVRYASEARNVDLTIVERPEAYYYLFTLRPFHGRPVLDDTRVFRVDRSSWDVQPVASVPMKDEGSGAN